MTSNKLCSQGNASSIVALWAHTLENGKVCNLCLLSYCFLLGMAISHKQLRQKRSTRRHLNQQPLFCPNTMVCLQMRYTYDQDPIAESTLHMEAADYFQLLLYKEFLSCKDM